MPYVYKEPLEVNSSPNRGKKKNNTWKIFLILIVFLLSAISVYFLFRHFKNKPTETAKKNQKDSDFQPKTKKQEQNIDYSQVQPTQKEPEWQGKSLPISSVGTDYKEWWEGSYKEEEGKFGSDDPCSDCGIKEIQVINILFEKCGRCGKTIEGDGKLRCDKCNKKKFHHDCSKNNMPPRGSALLTGSGDLEKQGIKAIIHACPGSMDKKNKDFQFNIQGIIRSVQNSILLAERNNYKSIAFCLIGSNFLDSIISPDQGTKKERQVKLAEIIVRTAIEQNKKLEKITFVDFGNRAFNDAFGKIAFEYSFGNKKGKAERMNATSGFTTPANDNDKPKEKGITDYSLHECEVIVNSLNIEGEFINSGSFSGFIASKTGSGKNQIQKDIKEYIIDFNNRLKK